MAYQIAAERAGKARRSRIVLKGLSVLCLTMASYGLMAPHTGGARVVDTDTEIPVVAARIAFDAGQPVITGSVASLFNTQMFTGTNRATKTDRATPRTNLAEFTQSFDAVRLSIAEARINGDMSSVGRSDVMVADADTQDAGPRMSVAAISPGAASDALRAIDSLAGGNTDFDPTIPRPASVPEALAFGRSNTPATDFTPKHSWSEREQWCLATGIYFEARGESYRGQVAVAQVIMNRVAHDNYPNTICGVVYQNQHRRNACQFSFACDGVTNVNRTNEVAAWARAKEVTAEVLNEEIYLTEVADATHYHATYVRPHWARNMTKLSQIGLHIFYKFKPGWQFG